MAITYPRDLPDSLLRPVRFSFDFEPIGAVSRTLGGQVSFQEKIGGTLWKLDLQSRPLREIEYAKAHSWKSSLHGASYAFKAYDLRRCYPIVYGASVLSLTRAAGGAFDGTATLSAAGGDKVSLTGLPASYTASEGDYFSFSWLGAQRLVKAVETAGANSSGVLNNLTIAPWLVAGGTTGVTVTMVRAWLLMRMVPGSWSGERTSGVDPVAFSAIEAPA